MCRYISDTKGKRWSIIEPSRLNRPEDDYTSDFKDGRCPFCEGNERSSGEEVLRFCDGQPNTPGWKVRVIPNKYPITEHHEVIIHAPHEDDDIDNLPLTHVTLLMKAYRERFRFYKDKGHVVIFRNLGEEGGASIKHPHSQLVVVPKDVGVESFPLETVSNIVDENKVVQVYCPNFSQWHYEVWMTPHENKGLFSEASDEVLGNLAFFLQKIVKRLEQIHEKKRLSKLPFGYNYYIYPHENWYLRIIPRFVHHAGFELATGMDVNVVDPVQAAQELRGVEDNVVGVMSKLRQRFQFATP